MPSRTLSADCAHASTRTRQLRYASALIASKMASEAAEHADESSTTDHTRGKRRQTGMRNGGSGPVRTPPAATAPGSRALAAAASHSQQNEDQPGGNEVHGRHAARSMNSRQQTQKKRVERPSDAKTRVTRLQRAGRMQAQQTSRIERDLHGSATSQSCARSTRTRSDTA